MYPEEDWLEPLRQSTERIRQKTFSIREETAAIRKETDSIRRQNASLESLVETQEKLKQIVEASLTKPIPMADSGPNDYFQWQQERQELREAVDMLGNFIAKHSKLNSSDSIMLAMQIFVNGESSGCVSAARAARLLAEAGNA